MAIRLQLSERGAQAHQNPKTTAADAVADGLSAAHFDGVLLRRSLAYLIDLAILGAVGVGFIALTGFLGLITFGLLWIGVGPLMLGLVIGYDAVTCAGAHRATPGMPSVTTGKLYE